jgi:hypothetical protein
VSGAGAVRFGEGADAPSGGLTLVSLYGAAAQAISCRFLRRGRRANSGAATWIAGCYQR